MKAGRYAVAQMDAGDGTLLQIRGIKDQQIASVLLADILHREQKAVAFGRLRRARREHGFAERIAIGHGEGSGAARCEVQLGDGIE